MKYQANETANAILRVRIGRNLTQYEFARKIKMSADAVAAWETGRNTLSQKTIDKISQILTKDEIKEIVEAVKRDKTAKKLYKKANTEAAE